MKMGKPELWHRIKSMCVECMGSRKDVIECTGAFAAGPCPIHPIRLGPWEPKQGDDGKLRPEYAKKQFLKLIYEKCRSECLSGNQLHICNSPTCPLFPIHCGPAVLKWEVREAAKTLTAGIGSPPDQSMAHRIFGVTTA